MKNYSPVFLALFFWSCVTVAAQTEPPKQKSTIEGDSNCLSLDFKDLPITDAFRVYFDAVRDNFVLDKNIVSNIELHLECVDSKTVLTALIAFSNTDVRKIDGVSYVTAKRQLPTVPPVSSPIATQTPQKIEKPVQKEPDITRLVKVYNSNATDIVAVIAKSSPDDQSNGITIKPIEDSNSIYISGQSKDVERLQQAIALIDKPKKQFMINARLISTSDTFLQNIGTTFNAGVSSGQIDTSANSAFTGLATALTGGSSLIFQKAGHVFLNTKIAAAISDGDAHLISEPRTIAYENKQSIINQGLRIPYQTQLPQGGYQITFIDAALTLQVTPRIGDNNGRIILDVYFSKNSAGSQTSVGTTIETREIRTTVALKSGETVMLGGIDETSKTTNDTGVPILKDVPVLGFIFGSESDDRKHNKLVLFITPTAI